MSSDDGRPSWEEHADGLVGEGRALAMLRALIDPDPAPLDAVLDDLRELIEHEDGVDVEALEDYQVALARIAIRLGQQAHGTRLDDVLSGLQADLAAHVAGYDPAGPDGSVPPTSREW